MCQMLFKYCVCVYMCVSVCVCEKIKFLHSWNFQWPKDIMSLKSHDYGGHDYIFLIEWDKYPIPLAPLARTFGQRDHLSDPVWYFLHS